MGKPVVVAIVGDNRGLRQSLDQSESRLSRFGSKAGKVGKVAALGVAGGAVIAGKALFDMAKNAAEDAAGQRRLAIALKNTANATKGQVREVENWITKMGVATGVTDDEMRPALQRLVQSTGDIGEAQDLMKLALDASAGSGKSLETVTTALAKANSGNMGALSRLGVRIKDTEGKTLSFTEVTKQMADTFGGQAAAKAQTLDGKMQRLRLIMDETKESIGAKLLPVAEKLANWFLREGLPAIQRFGTWFEANLLPPIRDFASKIGPKVKGVVDDFKKAFKDARPALELYGKYLKNVLVPVLKKAAEVILPAVGLALRAVGKYLGALGKIGTAMWNNVLAPVFKFFASAVSKVLSGLSKMFKALGKVPGMGWAKKAGKDLAAAATAASNLAAGIKKIPTSKTVTLKLDASPYLSVLNSLPLMPGGAGGTTPKVSTTTSQFSRGSTTFAQPVAVAPAPAAPAVQIDQVVLQVPVGGTAEDIGREFVKYVEAYYLVGGTRL